jgi:hypothetical protein
MSPYKNYENGSWLRIRRLPFMIALAMEGAGRSGIFGMASERSAMAGGLCAGPKDFPDNLLIHTIIPFKGSKQELILHTSEVHDEILDCLADLGIADHAGLVGYIYKIIPGVLSDLKAGETPETLKEYKAWILKMAMAVANAGKEGGFMGFGGEYFSEEERDIYSRLQELFS